MVIAATLFYTQFLPYLRTTLEINQLVWKSSLRGYDDYSSLGGYSLPEIMKFLWNSIYSTRPSGLGNATGLKYGTLGSDPIIVNINPEGNARVYFEVVEALLSKTPNWSALLS
jgi:hypothetical protein